MKVPVGVSSKSVFTSLNLIKSLACVSSVKFVDSWKNNERKLQNWTISTDQVTIDIDILTNLNESDVVFSCDIIVSAVRNNFENWSSLFGFFWIDQVHLSGNHCQSAYNLTKGQYVVTENLIREESINYKKIYAHFSIQDALVTTHLGL